MPSDSSLMRGGTVGHSEVFGAGPSPQRRHRRYGAVGASRDQRSDAGVCWLVPKHLNRALGLPDPRAAEQPEHLRDLANRVRGLAPAKRGVAMKLIVPACYAMVFIMLTAMVVLFAVVIGIVPDRRGDSFVDRQTGDLTQRVSAVRVGAPVHLPEQARASP